ncbi:hypothetical protein [Flavobacterium sp.]|uniref:hypothetical protein n=1 Tax=Flavobacterium sp. TaxID=239 RepID=UPI003D6B15B3
MSETISYSDKAKGWTSFHSFIPDWMAKLNNRMYSIKDGQLWLHNDESNPVRNNFYGEQYNSKIIAIFNEAPSDDKIFKTINLEGNLPWDVTVRTNYTESTITKEEFNHRESRWFAYTRKNENQNDLTGHTAQGIGVILSSVGLTITFGNISNMISEGDILYQVNGSVNEIIGTITSIAGNVITVDSVATPPVPGYFSFAKKNARIEGSEIRGYYMEVELENDDTVPVELFAINTNAVKSYV